MVSALRAQEMLNDFGAANVQGFRKMRRPLGTNVSRKLRKTSLRNKLWPTDYKALIRVKNKSTCVEDAQLCSFL